MSSKRKYSRIKDASVEEHNDCFNESVILFVSLLTWINKEKVILELNFLENLMHVWKEKNYLKLLTSTTLQRTDCPMLKTSERSDLLSSTAYQR